MGISNDCRPEAGRTRGILSRTLTVCFSIFIAFMLMGVPQANANHMLDPPAGAASGMGIYPEFFEGNPTCSQLPGVAGIQDMVEFRINDPFTGQFSDGDLTVNIVITGGNTFAWTSSGGSMEGIFVKGGPNGNLFDYFDHQNVDTNTDSLLHSPLNKQGRFYGLSHISFCYIPGAPSIDVTKDCTDQSPSGEVSTYQHDVTIHNDGDFTLTNVQLREEVNTFTSCKITHVGGADVADVGLPYNTLVTVPNGGAYTGSLAVGASVVVKVECIDSDLNTVNTIKAKGIAPDSNNEMVMDTDSSDPLRQCLASPDPEVTVDKDCPADSDVRLMGMNGMLVAEVCPTIIITNTGRDTLTQIIASDPDIPALQGGIVVQDGGVNVQLAPTESVDLGTLYDLCYMPSAPEVAAFDDHGTPTDMSDDKYLPSHSGFYNRVDVLAQGFFGLSDIDWDDTALRNSSGVIQYLMDNGEFVRDSNGDLIPLSECPLCAPCPDCDI